jgi:hypothetical protein
MWLALHLIGAAMLLSMAGSMQPAPPQPTSRDNGLVQETRLINLLRVEPDGSGTRLTPVAAPPVAASAPANSNRPLSSEGYGVLLEAQARSLREEELFKVGLEAANRSFNATLRDFIRPETGDQAVFRNGIVLLRLRSEQEVRIAQDLYERYQAARFVGATPEEIAELEMRFARLAGWPPLPPVRLETVQGGSLGGVAAAISFLEGQGIAPKPGAS